MKKTLLTILTLSLVLNFPAGGSLLLEGPAGPFEQPLLLTSAGQNADVQMAAVLAKRAGLNYNLAKLATAKDLEKMKTLALVLGASLKGLGAAGLDMDKENTRIAALIAAAQKANIAILCLHLGGEGRRGAQTDELIADILPLAGMAIIVKSGNADGIFTKICRAKNIPLVEVEKTADALTPLKNAFK
jgi:hypothetical protein